MDIGFKAENETSEKAVIRKLYEETGYQFEVEKVNLVPAFLKTALKNIQMRLYIL